MNNELVLAILYDLTLTIGSESRVAPLLTRVLQRLLYHTGFPVGVALLEPADHPFGRAVTLAEVVGDHHLSQRKGERVVVPACLCSGPIALLEDPELLGPLRGRRSYASVLTLPIEGEGSLLLLTPGGRPSQLPLTQIFQPALGNLAKAIRLCRDNEELNASLLAARDEAQAANQAKSVFLASMSHEIRTPMNAILGFTHLLQREIVDPRHADKLAKIAGSAQHLLGILNDILDLSKIEADRMSLESTSVDVDAILDHVRTMLTERAESKGLTLQVEVDPELRGVPLLGDPLRLSQILLNYVSNAIKFTPRGSVVLRCRRTAEDPGGVGLRFEVQDSGIGVDPAQLSRLFEPFEQANNSTTRQYGGTGLGLAICRRLAYLMGGDVGVDSRPGLGSTFWFSVRLARGTAVAPSTRAALRIRRGARVLLVEDNPTNQEVGRELLRGFGLAVDTANDGAEAVRRVQDEIYDLILMDMQMPVMDGVAATRAIRALPNHLALPIVAMTANTFAEDRRQCLAAGMNDFLGKPIDPALLQSTLARWVPVRQSAAAARAAPASEPGVVDLEAGLRHVGGSRDLYQRLLRMFADTHGDDQLALREAADRAEWKELRRLAHSLKGAAATLGLTRVRDAAAALEQLVARDPSAPVGPAIEEVAAVLARANQEIARLVEPVEVPVVDPARKRVLISRLEALLSTDDASASDVWREVSPLLAPEVPATTLSSLDDHIDAYDFPAALTELRALRSASAGLDRAVEGAEPA